MVNAAKRVGISKGQCLCGKIRFEIDTPARWAWHDPSLASRRAHGAAYATYVGSWRKRLRITRGKSGTARYEDKATGTVRSATCGTPLFHERGRAPHMVNIPRALLEGRTGRQPLYHIAIEQLREWAYTGEPLVPLNVFPVWSGNAQKRRSRSIAKGCFKPRQPRPAVARVRGDDHYVGMEFVDPPVDFAGVAKSLGLEAIRITYPGQAEIDIVVGIQPAWSKTDRGDGQRDELSRP